MENEEQKYARVMDRDGFSPDWPQAAVPGARPGLGLRLFLRMMGNIRIGTLDVRLPNGELRSFRGSERLDMHGVLIIKDASLMGYVLKNGEVGFGEAYMDGLWESPDLPALLAMLYLNEPYYAGPYEKNPVARLLGWVKHKLNANSKAQARKNISYHYDLGNDFYKLWLDDSMAYSSGVFLRREESMRDQSGVFAGSGATLAEAQQHKFELMYQRLDLKPEHRVLEIGSGWGGFAIYAAQKSGCRVHSITLSAEQMAEARLRAQAAGIADRVTFELRDYRDLQDKYDRIVSIEMYEAVGEEYWPGYFKAIHDALLPGGRAAIQGITIHPEIYDQYRRKIDFIQKYIFPGGMLATPGVFMDLAAKAGLNAVQPQYYGLDYADTLAAWHRSVLEARAHIVRMFDERFLRMWRYYLSYCECGFRVGRVNLMQITLQKV